MHYKLETLTTTLSLLALKGLKFYHIIHIPFAKTEKSDAAGFRFMGITLGF